jgi:hypothetical protein
MEINGNRLSVNFFVEVKNIDFNVSFGTVYGRPVSNV